METYSGISDEQRHNESHMFYSWFDAGAVTLLNHYLTCFWLHYISQNVCNIRSSVICLVFFLGITATQMKLAVLLQPGRCRKETAILK